MYGDVRTHASRFSTSVFLPYFERKHGVAHSLVNVAIDSASNRATINGVAETPGQVLPSKAFKKGAVLTRTNKGMIDAIFKIMREDEVTGESRTWAFATKGSNK